MKIINDSDLQYRIIIKIHCYRDSTTNTLYQDFTSKDKALTFINNDMECKDLDDKEFFIKYEMFKLRKKEK